MSIESKPERLDDIADDATVPVSGALFKQLVRDAHGASTGTPAKPRLRTVPQDAHQLAAKLHEIREDAENADLDLPEALWLYELTRSVHSSLGRVYDQVHKRAQDESDRYEAQREAGEDDEETGSP